MPQLSFSEVQQLGLKAHQAGRFPEAEYYYRQLLPHDPENPRLLHALGLVCHQTDRPEEALRWINQAIELSPNEAEFHNNRGEVYRVLGNYSRAKESYKQALALRPDYADALTNLGSAHQFVNDFTEAERLHYQARQLSPDSPIVLNNLGTVMDQTHRRKEARECYRQAIKLNDRYLNARINLIKSFLADRQSQPASEEVEKALGLFPGSNELWLLEARCLKESDRTTEAIQCLEKHLDQFQKLKVEALSYLASCYHGVGDLDTSLKVHEQVLDLSPNNLHSAYTRLTFLNYSSGHEPERMFQEHLNFTQRFYPQHVLPPIVHPKRDTSSRKLKLGYISNDFKNHSVSRFILPVIESHDAERFEVHCFTLNEVEDNVTRRFQRASHYWHKSWTDGDEELLREIQKSNIDILVDLGGLFGGRLGLLARQAAPIQVCFLGYPNTTGLSTIQYRFTDTIADPPGLTDSYHTEALWRLPDCAWSYRPMDAEVEPGGLPADRFPHFTFGCFHGIHKYRPIMLNAWAEILSQVPNSILVIKSYKGLGQSETRNKFRVYFEKVGVDLNRIKFVPSSMGEQEHLQLFNNIDLALDTYPYNGTTVTCEALWMGVPSITLAGPSHVCRVGASLLTHAGVPEGVATSPDDYVQRAVALANNLPRLRELRSGLRPHLQSCAMGNHEIYTRNLEEAYLKMWKNIDG